MVWNNVHSEATISTEKIIHVPSEFGVVTCMDLYFDATILACGTIKGTILFVDVQKNLIIQHFSNIHKV